MSEDTHYTSQVKGKSCVYKRCWHRYLCGHTVLWVGIAIFLDSKWAQRNHLSLPHFRTHNLAHPLFIFHGSYSFCFSASKRRGGHHRLTETPTCITVYFLHPPMSIHHGRTGIASLGYRCS